MTFFVSPFISLVPGDICVHFLSRAFLGWIVSEVSELGSLLKCLYKSITKVCVLNSRLK